MNRPEPQSPNNLLDRAVARNVEWRPAATLRPAPRNARTHSDQQIRQIATSIRAFGFTNPVLVDEQGTILAGHGRVAAAERLGMTEVPTLRIGHMTEAQKRAYVLADNRIAERAGWDREILRIELQSLIDLDFDVEPTGFTTGEADLLIDGPNGMQDEADDDLPDVPAEPVSRLGDLWLLGPHRLLCADALSETSYERLLEGLKAQMVFIDPPYNVQIDGNVCGKGRVRHAEFAMASGELTEGEFTSFRASGSQLLARHSARASVHFVCMDWRHIGEALTAGCTAYTKLLNLCVWTKSNAGMGSFYRSQHELVLVYQSGGGRPINTFNLGEYGRHRANVWSYPGVNAFGHRRDE